METLIVYINDSEYARNQLAAMIDVNTPTKCILVGCPPKLNRHVSRWISGAATTLVPRFRGHLPLKGINLFTASRWGL